jgi:hypothetical protein
MPFIPDPEAAKLKDGVKFLRELQMKMTLDTGEVRVPHVRIEHREGLPVLTLPKKRRRLRNVPVRRAIRWAWHQTMKRSFSQSIRSIVEMVAGVRGHVNLTMWRDPDNLMVWNGTCDDCGAEFKVMPAYWRVFPHGLVFKGMAYVDDCPTPQPIREVPRKPKAEPFSRLLRPIPRL